LTSSAPSSSGTPGSPRGRLSILGTPIGNLQDITLRALATLRAADVVLAEDTRQTRKLLSHHGISAKLRALHAHSSEAAIERCLADLAEGLHLALVSDAGTPLISDPGAQLVRAASERGVEIETIPGPSAVIAALSVSGVEFDAFRFVGFAPRTGAKRKAWLSAIASDPSASVFFESPARLAATLQELAAVLHPERVLAVCRELTKVHEEVVRGTASALAERFAAGARGEITVVVGAGSARAAEGTATETDDIDARIAALLEQGLSARDVSRRLSRETSLPRRQLYALATSAAARRPERPS
jgi:16S rRNA (cytidine1402-2'-O)-methyltransferase